MNENFMDDRKGLIANFINSLKADIDSPINSNFGAKISDYRIQAQQISEEIEVTSNDFEKVYKASKDVEEAMYGFSKSLLSFKQVTKEVSERFSPRCDSENDCNAAVALLKMGIFIQDESQLLNAQTFNWQNNIVHPLGLIAKNEVRVRNVDKACREYENRFMKVEADARKQAKQVGYTRSQLSHGELSEQLYKERICAQQELCKFLLSMDSFEDKQASQLLRHFLEFFKIQNVHHMDRLKLSTHLQKDLEKLEKRVTMRNAVHSKARSDLFDLKDRLELCGDFYRTSSGRRISSSKHESQKSVRLSVSNFAGTSSSGITCAENEACYDISGNLIGDELRCSGYLYKKSNKKIHKQWQKRKCEIRNGHFFLSHSDEALLPVELKLSVSDCKPSSDDPKSFDLYFRDRTYHMQAETELEARKWVVMLKQEIMRLKTKMLTGDPIDDYEKSGDSSKLGLNLEEQQINTLRKLRGNKECADCASTDGVQWLSNTGALVCIACSGVHRELGVHISRIHSIDLDVVPPIELLVPLASGNALINRLYEHNLDICSLTKPSSTCNRVDRQKFIQSKYRDRRFVELVNYPDRLFKEAVSELDFEKAYRAILSKNLSPEIFESEGAFHQMIRSGDPLSLPIAQLVVQFRFDIPALESMLTDCVNLNHVDLLMILLHYRPSCAPISDLTLQGLELLAVKSEKANIAELIKLARSNQWTQLNNVNIPSLFFFPVADSSSLDCSSSSVSPLLRPSPDASAQPQTSRSPSPKLKTSVLGDSPRISSKRGELVNEEECATGKIALPPLLTFNGCSKDNNDGGGSFLPLSNSDHTVKNIDRFSTGFAEQRLVSVDNLYTTVAMPGKQPNLPVNNSWSSTVHAPALPVQPKPKLYHRSASEFTDAERVENSRAGGDQNLRKLASGRQISSTFREGTSTQKSLDLVEPADSLSMLDPISLVPSSNRKEDDVMSERGTSSSRISLSCAEKREIMANRPQCSEQTVSDRVSKNSTYHSLDSRSNQPTTFIVRDLKQGGSTDVGCTISTNLENGNVMNDESIVGQRKMFSKVSRPVPAVPSTSVRIKPPIPAPRRSVAGVEKSQPDILRRCRALYDCTADNPDELTFRQGDIIIVSREQISGENDTWMEGYLACDPRCKGVFPVTFVTFLS